MTHFAFLTIAKFISLSDDKPTHWTLYIIQIVYEISLTSSVLGTDFIFRRILAEIVIFESKNWKISTWSKKWKLRRTGRDSNPSEFPRQARISKTSSISLIRTQAILIYVKVKNLKIFKNFEISRVLVQSIFLFFFLT